MSRGNSGIKLLFADATIARRSVAGFARARIGVFATVVVRVVIASVLVGVLRVCSQKIERWVSKRNEMEDMERHLTQSYSQW
jgi:hypothetical protein